MRIYALVLLIVIVLLYRYQGLFEYRYAIYNVIRDRVFKRKNNTITLHDGYAHIEYYKDGDLYTLRVPRIVKNRYNPNKIILIKNIDDVLTETDITHHHGIPYFLSAKDLGGDYLTKRLYDEDVGKFDQSEVPSI